MLKFIQMSAVIVLMLCANTTYAQANSEAPDAFVKRYIQEVGSTTKPQDFSKFWRAKARKYIHDTEESTLKELKLSAKMHELFLIHGSFDAAPEINEWGDADNTISYTFPLTTAVPNDIMKEHFMMAPADYSEYQISIEKEDDKWVVSGESFVGSF